MVRRKIILFGGSGYLGNALIERLYNPEISILVVSRNEGSLVACREKFPFIEIMVGDISDRWIVKKAMKGADEVHLLAALKHVGIAEKEVRSCVTSNIIGVMNIIEESFITKPKLLLFVSTDKASQPTGIYGCSKKIGEGLMSEAGKINTDTKYRTVRFGNVFFSTGSFITKWKPKMQRGEEIIITDPNATRFFFPVKDAVDLIFECIEKSVDATPFIPVMKAVSMGVVLEACLETYGNCPVKQIGLQPGENFKETMDGINFSDTCEQFTKEEFIEKFLI